MRAVSNTSPISNLLRVGAVDLLFKLFDEVWIPPAVASELLRFHAELPARLCILAPINTGRVQQLRDQLDDGEAEAIVLADELGTDWLIIDEKPGRRVARAEGIRSPKARSFIGCENPEAVGQMNSGRNMNGTGHLGFVLRPEFMRRFMGEMTREEEESSLRRLEERLQSEPDLGQHIRREDADNAANHCVIQRYQFVNANDRRSFQARRRNRAPALRARSQRPPRRPPACGVQHRSAVLPADPRPRAGTSW